MGNDAPKLTPEGFYYLEEAKQNKRIIDRACRTVLRERLKNENDEKKLIYEIKTLAKKNNHNAAKILIKDLVRIRKHIDQMYLMHSQLKAMALNMNSIVSNLAISNALKQAATTMNHVNASMDLNQIKQVIKSFSKESGKLEIRQDAVY